MLPHFGDAGDDTSSTIMTLAALRSYLDSKGVDSQKWWLKVQTTILQVRTGDSFHQAGRLSVRVQWTTTTQ